MRTSGVLRGAVAAVAVVNAVAAAVGLALLPLAEAWDGASEGTAFGIATGALGLGALGGPVLGRIAARWRLGPRVWLVVLGGCLVGVVPAPSLWVAVPLLIVVGAAAVQVEIVATAYVQRAAPDRLRASVLGLTDTAMVAAALLGALVSPALARDHRRGAGRAARRGGKRGRDGPRASTGRAGWQPSRNRSPSLPEQYSGGVDFWSSYAHGFARVAACTIPVAIADPARNAEVVLEQARACHEDVDRPGGVPGAVAVRLRDRRPADAGHPARRGARRDRHGRGGIGRRSCQ